MTNPYIEKLASEVIACVAVSDFGAERIVRAILTAMKYEDGADESRLIAVSNKHRIEAVTLIEAWDDMINAILAGSPAMTPAETPSHPA